MSTSQCILLISADPQLSQIFHSLPYFSNAFQLQEVANMNTALLGLKDSTDHLLPHTIIVDFAESLEETILFLESLAVMKSPDATIRIIFVMDKENQKQAMVLSALGDFDFVFKPLSEEKIFNSLVQSKIHSY